MNKKGSARPIAVYVLIFLHVFLGLNGLWGGASFVAAPNGSLLQVPLSYLERSPFSNFFIPGLLLFLFLGVFPLAVAYSLWKRPAWHWPDLINPFKRMHWSWAASLAVGVIAAVWIGVQVQWIPASFLQTFILSLGIVIVLGTLLPPVRSYYARGDRP